MVVQKIYDLLNELDRKVNELQRSIDDKLPHLPGFLADRVSAAWNGFCDMLGELFASIGDWLSRAGSPGAVTDTADDWVTKVGGPVSGQATVADIARLKTDNEWKGDAAKAYADMMPLHKDILNAVKGFADNTATALNSVATGITIFWVGIGAALAELLLGIAGAIGASGTIIGLPAAPVIAGSAVVFALATMGGVAFELNRRATDANTDLLKVLNDRGKLVGGRWPSTFTL
ncbi:hypothetical protein [Actinoplanes couchii]|uniref:WXG100 family type VII secretion target n=1 Tax=Actinoplanes couchii TaxID=403638 RepID=A0ABQ3WZR8_9ACTN|nr:hypothetical protein [Actinoplanes couchii]MDR6316032.1 hypothetical protein [Actinoplanes couchii]GID51645.1 hypothetical protein Aco03nite_000490 [Actinoplanes couchii]